LAIVSPTSVPFDIVRYLRFLHRGSQSRRSCDAAEWLEKVATTKPPSEASKALIGCRIMRKWEGFGWCMGKITRVNDDARRSIGGDKINFFAHYEIDGEEEPDVPHVLQLSEYQTTDDAEYDSWLLLEEAVGVPAEAATEAVEPEPGVPAEAATEAVEPEPMEVATA
jgi:hypothetical protein